jgi:hypothetical protein
MTPHALAARLLTHGDLLPEVLRPWLPDTIDPSSHRHSSYTAAQLLQAVPSTEAPFREVPRAHVQHAASALHAACPDHPLPIICLSHLAQHHFTWTRGTARFLTANYLEWLEDPYRRLLTAAVWLTFQSFDIADDCSLLHPRPLNPAMRAELFRSALLPDIDNPMLDALRQQGLPELHRHRNLASLPDRVWSQLLLSPALAQANTQPCPIAGITWTSLLRWVRHLRNTWGDSTVTLQPIHACPDEALLQDPNQSAEVNEREFLYGLLCQAADAKHDLAGRVLHAYLLIRALVTSRLLQPNYGQKGLDRFVTDYTQHPWTDKASDHVPPQSSLVQMVRNGAVHWAELRHGTKDPAKKLTQLADALQRARDHSDASATAIDAVSADVDLRQPGHDRDGRRLPGVRLILHFIKKPDKHKPASHPVLWRRFRLLRADLRAESEAIYDTLYNHPHRNLIVGLDVASLETAVPIEVFSPYLRALRSTPGLPDRVFLPDLNTAEQAGLGLSIHAGEEFHNLTSGLRTIDESIRFCSMQAGDRIGHGLALGLDPVDWAERQGGAVYQTRLSLLDDLVWAQPRLHATQAAPALLHWVDRKIEALAEQLYGTNPSPTTLFRAWELRAALPDDPVDPVTTPLHHALRADQRRRLHPGGPTSTCTHCDSPFPHSPQGPHCLWRRYWTDAALFTRGEALELVTLDERWTTALRHLQDDMLRDISRRGIAIEANPSSNVAIGPIDRYRDHPIFRWHPPGADPNAIRPLVVIGTDDPAIFGMELAQEYAALACAAQQRGHSPREILAWLHDLRKTGLQLLFSGAGPQA